ncbi:MAG TPA: FHA domain-containing protein [Polyangia bacterium]|jgi:predicted component of type VI protein secretion system
MPTVAHERETEMILEVRIKAPPGGTNRTLRFTKSPIRIGRNQLNDISLDDPFVSEWHGTIRFDVGSIAYFDLGSTNGTELDGKRLAKNVPMELTEASRLRLGLLELSVVRPAAEAETAPRQPHGSGLFQTLAWGQLAPNLAALDAAKARQQPVNISGGGSSERTGGVPASSATGPVTPPPEPAGRKADGKVPARYEKLLDAFAESFIGLRKGYEQFGREVGVRTINGATPLHRTATRDDLIKYFLQPDLDVTATARELIAIFADFGIHHIAMMQGVTEGVRAMLETLSPQANDLEAASKLFGGAKAKGQWKAYLERFEQMLTDDNVLHAAVFGNEFARAYASVTIGVGAKPPKQDPES